MRRKRALKIVLVMVGLLFCAGVYPLTMLFSREPAVPMIMSIYVTLGIFLLLAVRDPAANRSLIAFGGWANLAHAGVMGAQEYRNVIERRELAGVVVFAIVGVVLLALAPAQQSTERVLRWMAVEHLDDFVTANACSRRRELQFLCGLEAAEHLGQETEWVGLEDSGSVLSICKQMVRSTSLHKSDLLVPNQILGPMEPYCTPAGSSGQHPIDGDHARRRVGGLFCLARD
jgi:hypothetical protein